MKQKSFPITMLILASLTWSSCKVENTSQNRATNIDPGAQNPPVAKTEPVEMLRAVEVPANSSLVLTDSAYGFAELVLNDNSVVSFTAPNVNITAVKLTLHGKSTIDLTSKLPTPPKPSTPPGQGQAGNEPAPQSGPNGSSGSVGGDASSPTNLNLSLQQLDASDGSLWIRIDGSSGGAGGDGGKGGKGSSGPSTCVNNPNGGNGGVGGAGGNGGNGSGTAKVVLKIGPNSITPTQASGVAPSARPAGADLPGTIVVAGSPGGGGPGGQGGLGGDEGEGHEGPGGFFCPSTDSQSGARGPVGPAGKPGVNGKFVP